MKQWLQKWTTSKKITWLFITFYLIFISIAAFVNVKWKIDLSKFLDCIQPVIMTIIIFYFSKSGAENCVKIKTSSQENNENVEG